MQIHIFARRTVVPTVLSVPRWTGARKGRVERGVQQTLQNLKLRSEIAHDAYK